MRFAARRIWLVAFASFQCLLWSSVGATSDSLPQRAALVSKYLNQLSWRSIEARPCDTAPAAMNAGSRFQIPPRSLSNLDGTYAKFVKFFGGRPAETDIAYFLEDLSTALLSAAVTRHTSPSNVLEIAFDYRFILSRAQRELCTPSWLVSHYEAFFNRLNAITGPIKSPPTTLEGFLLTYLRQNRAIDRKDLRFIDRYMIDSPLNRSLRSVLVAHSSLPANERLTAVSSLCREYERIGSHAAPVAASDSAAVSSALEKPTCVSLEGTPGGEPIAISRSTSFFSVLKTNGADLQLVASGGAVPIIDSSASQKKFVLAPQAKRPGSDAAAVPLLIGIRRKTPDGGSLPLLNRFDIVYVLIHAVLKQADDAAFDSRPLPTALRGGHVKLRLSASGQPAIAFVSGGQPGAVVAAPAEPGAGLESYVRSGVLQEFLLSEGADLFSSSSDRVLMLGTVNQRQLSGLLLAGSSDRRLVPDFSVEVPMEWLRTLNDEQRSALDSFCGAKAAEPCISDLILVQMLRLVQGAFQSCKSQSDIGCDPTKLGVGERLVIQPGKPGLPRLPGRGGEPGKLTVEHVSQQSVSGKP